MKFEATISADSENLSPWVSHRLHVHTSDAGWHRDVGRLQVCEEFNNVLLYEGEIWSLTKVWQVIIIEGEHEAARRVVNTDTNRNELWVQLQ